MSGNPSTASAAHPAGALAAAAAASSSKNGGKKDPSKIPIKKKVRRKKPPSNKGPTSQAVMAAARTASGELNSVKAAEAARRKDPLWYRSSEVLQAISADASPVPGLLTEQIDLVETALQQNQLSRSDITPQAFGVLLEQARRYALELVADAQDCAYAAHRHDITRADLMMALELRPDQANTHTLGELQKMTMVSHNVNKMPLPPIPQHCYSGIVLPPKPHQLTARTFDIITGAQTAKKMNQALPVPKKTSIVTSNPSYGASRGRLIPISMNAASTAPPMVAAAATAAPMTGVTPPTSIIPIVVPPQGVAPSGIKRKAGELQ